MDNISSQTSDEPAPGELILIDLKNRTSRFITSHGYNSSFALDSAETLLATTGEDGIVRVGPVTGEEPHMLLPPGEPSGPAISPDGRWIACAESFKSVESARYYLWHTPKGRPLHTLPHKEFMNYLRAQTNLRVIPDKLSNTGYKVDTAPFPGWEKVPPK
jgi:hypothetical protein